ncbi:TonB-linked outer membrane protein, SusC/RagA family [bacterium A37T11]|nr:TonB-linked outer membrane protein, SusC/RagA family [bacterium A37T11]
MRIILIGVISGLFALLPRCSFGQKISIDARNVTLITTLEHIKKQAEINFFYNDQVMAHALPVSIQIKDAELEDVLKRIFVTQPIQYKIRDKVVVLSLKPELTADIPQLLREKKKIILCLVDARSGQAISGANLYQSSKNPAISDQMGHVTLINPLLTDTIHIHHIGYQDIHFLLRDLPSQLIALVPFNNQLNEVLVTGIVNRNKYNFTSAVTVMSGATLKMLDNRNIINSISTLDPSFALIANNLRGSDPNKLGQIELRGKTSISGLQVENQYANDPNQPLFILDGFESTLSQITELDINRIATVTLLKDAASSALYGARSANGVVVVETVKPQAGDLNIYYNADVNLELADLSDYNMMNSTEKVDFERLSGRFESVVKDEPNSQVVVSGDQFMLDRLYNQRNTWAQEGINTYWLDNPLQTGFSQNHSLYLQGGNNDWQVGGGGNYKDIHGVMKGTGRNNWGAWGDIGYRKGKWNIRAKSFLSGYHSYGSPTSNFADYVKQNPYYREGDTAKYLATVPTVDDSQTSIEEPNHIYNDLQNSFSRGSEWNFQQNIVALWQLNPQWQFSANLQVQGGQNTQKAFISPKDTRFDNQNAKLKGSYDYLRQNRKAYQGNIMATWNKTFRQKHILTVNGRAEIQENDLNLKGYTLKGFPSNADGNPSQSYQAQPVILPPLESPPTIRRIDALASANYTYDHRYFADATWRIDGSTQFGSAHRYASFWSAGIGWNVNREPFMRSLNTISLFRLRINTGLTGNQNFGSFASTIAYTHLSDSSLFGQGLVHNTLGNPQLRWQNTQQTNLGMDLELWDQRFSLTINLYKKNTDPLIATINLPASNGTTNFTMNVGILKVSGLDAIWRFSPIYRPREQVIWTIGATMSMYKSQYEGLAALLKSQNQDLLLNNSLFRFMDGNSPDDLWAVPSQGIDPSSGREVFMTKDGKHTFNYDQNDIVVVGNSRPLAEGILSSFFNYKALTFGVYMRYVMRNARFNEALYNKVENITYDELSDNQDSRALYNRWKVPGDIARFKGISITDYTPISSRFIQKESYLSGESISISYEFEGNIHNWLHTASIHKLRLTLYMNDVFRLSNILAERGTEYPFSRTFSGSISMIF